MGGPRGFNRATKPTPDFHSPYSPPPFQIRLLCFGSNRGAACAAPTRSHADGCASDPLSFRLRRPPPHGALRQHARVRYVDAQLARRPSNLSSQGSHGNCRHDHRLPPSPPGPTANAARCRCTPATLSTLSLQESNGSGTAGCRASSCRRWRVDTPSSRDRGNASFVREIQNEGELIALQERSYHKLVSTLELTFELG